MWVVALMGTTMTQCAGRAAVSTHPESRSKHESGANTRIAGDNETWIQWDSSENAWACCGDNGCDGTTTGETFKGVAPAQYSAVPSVATSASSSAATSTKSSTTSSTGTAGTTPASSDDNNDGGNSNDDGGLSSGTIGGIAAGVAIGVVAVLAAVGFFVWRRRRSNKMNDTAEPGYRDDKWHSSEQSTPPEYASHYTPTHSHQPYPSQSAYGQQEIYAKRAQGAELDSAQPPQSPQEMPAQGSKVFGWNVHELQSSSPPQRHELGGEGSGTK